MAGAAQRFIEANFRLAPGRGFATSKTATDRAYASHAERDENVEVARFTNLLFRYTGDERGHATADAAMRYLAARENALRPLSGGVLLAEDEFTTDPIHITVVGAKGDTAAAELFQTAGRFPSRYRRLEWQDRSEGAPVRDDIQYPQLARAAAFLCGARSCSKPLFTPEALQARIRSERH